MSTKHSKVLIHTANIPDAPPQRPAKKKDRRRKPNFHMGISFHERLLRNSFLACAVLLGILALGNLEQPWAKKASNHIEKALTMDINLDESLGQLSFVRKLMPESALVFFNLSSEHEYQRPANGELTHAYSASQPWLMFASAPGSAVYAIADGMVSAVSPLSDGSYGVLIDHGNGLESVTANLLSASVQAGDPVPKGGVLGNAGENTYFELRQGGQAVDPSEKMGL